MIPVKSLRLELGTTLAADSATLAPAVNANLISLVVSPFTPNENLAIGTLTLASFTGSTPIAGATGSQPTAIDPFTEQQRIIIKPPVGGYIFTCTVAPSPPQTVYGFILTDHTGATLLAMALLPVPVTISEIGHFVDCGEVNLIFVPQPMS
jgi:hypothetical protein